MEDYLGTEKSLGDRSQLFIMKLKSKSHLLEQRGGAGGGGRGGFIKSYFPLMRRALIFVQKSSNLSCALFVL